MSEKRWWLYILKLENEKWYVGITSKTPEARFREHQLGIRGAYWTKVHKPIEIEKFEDLGIVSKEHAETYENTITRQLMKEKGLNNVRGGDLTNTEDYIVRFGWVYSREGWDMAMGVILLSLIIVALVLDKYNWDLRMVLFIILVTVCFEVIPRLWHRMKRDSS